MPQYLFHDSLATTAKAVPDKVAIIANGQRYTYQELYDSARCLARGLQDLGLQRGERVAVYMDNSWSCAVSIYAILLAGGVMMVMNPQTKAEKLTELLWDSEASFLLTDKGGIEDGLEGRAHLKWIVSTAAEADVSKQLLSFDEVLATAAPNPTDVGTIPLDLAALIYTSGSTGHPKGVMMTHQNMVFTMTSVIDYLRLTSEDRILNVLPLAFSYGLYQLFMSVTLGATLLLEHSFSFPMQIVEQFQKEQITVFPSVPTMFATLLSLAKKNNFTLPSVKCITNAADALPEQFTVPLQELFPNALIFKMYGLTECKRVCYLEPELVAQKPFSVGKAIPGTEIFLRSETGEPVPPGETGILHVRGPHVMLGYWKKPELTAHMLKAGRYPGERILCTHDQFRMDEEGFLYFVGRSDDIIKTRGEKVSPVEVENVLHGIPGIKNASVIGVPHEIFGEAVCAYVVLEDGSTLGEQAIKRACLAHLESYMVPSKIVFVSDLPKTGSGKVRKKDLRELSVKV